MSSRHTFLFLLSRLQAELNRLFTEFEGLGEAIGDETGWVPAVDVFESDSTLVLLATVPGLRAEELRLEISGDMVTIAGTRRPIENDESDADVLRAERRSGEFRRRIQLPRPVNSSQAVARLSGGILEVSFPRIVDQRQKSRVISITEAER